MSSRPQKIVVDARMLYATGIGRYIRELLEGLQKLDTINQYIVIVRPQDRSAWKPTAANFSVTELDAPIYSFAEQTKLPRLLRSLKPDLVHFPSFNSPILYGGKRVTTVHDLTLLDFNVARGSLGKRSVYSLKRLVAKIQFRIVLRRSTEIITDVKYVKQQLITRKLAAASNITAIWLGASLQSSSAKQQRTISAPYLLYVGNYYPYKNIGILVEALPLLLEQHPGLQLVLVGKSDEFSTELRNQAKRLGVEKQVIFAGFVPDGELVGLYQHASAYVFPSLSEGFGLPPLEAMAHDLPVAAANASCIPEVCGDAAIYFDPQDASDVAQEVSKLLDNTELRQSLIAKGRDRLKQFSWEQTATRTLEVYNKALDKSN